MCKSCKSKVEHTVCHIHSKEILYLKVSRTSIHHVFTTSAPYLNLQNHFQAIFFEENMEPVMSQSILRNPTVTGRRVDRYGKPNADISWRPSRGRRDSWTVLWSDSTWSGARWGLTLSYKKRGHQTISWASERLFTSVSFHGTGIDDLFVAR